MSFLITYVLQIYVYFLTHAEISSVSICIFCSVDGYVCAFSVDHPCLCFLMVKTSIPFSDFCFSLGPILFIIFYPLFQVALSFPWFVIPICSLMVCSQFQCIITTQTESVKLKFNFNTIWHKISPSNMTILNCKQGAIYHVSTLHVYLTCYQMQH